MTDYGDENPLLMDYYGFQPELYKLKFKSRGDSTLSQRVVQLYKEVRNARFLMLLNRVHVYVFSGWSGGSHNLET